MTFACVISEMVGNYSRPKGSVARVTKNYHLVTFGPASICPLCDVPLRSLT